MIAIKKLYLCRRKKLSSHEKRVSSYETILSPDEKAVLAIDSFKGCLTSAEAEAAAAEGVHAALPECEVIRIPVADGGEGMLDVLIAATHGKSISVQAHGPLMELREACYGISGDGADGFHRDGSHQRTSTRHPGEA